MSAPRLSVVVPTRNRPLALRRLLTDIAAQTIGKADFEIVVVDDGSTPAVDIATVTDGLELDVRLLRRDAHPGAHESRLAGAEAARGARVLFLDDDVVLAREVLAGHAGVDGDFAIGPILYHPEPSPSPYNRFKAAQYATEAEQVVGGPSRRSADELYICNASGPTTVFREILGSVRTMMNGRPTPGEGFDEALMGHQLSKQRSFTRVLPSAVVYHVDTKTLGDARNERRHVGRAVSRLLVEMPELRQTIGHYARIADTITGAAGLARMWKVRLIWMAPTAFRLVTDALTATVDRGPARWIPDRLCRAPLVIAFWEGVRADAPSYAKLRDLLRESKGI